MRVNHNISALKANVHLSRSESLLSKSAERLSSGYKINHAYDDAAGFSIAKKMRTQIKALERASQNAADGISVIQSAEGALNEVSAMLIRMKELAVQAANDTNSGEDRDAIQREVDQLKSEIDRISKDSDFNTKPLLNGEVGRKGITNNPYVEVIKNTESVFAGSYGISVTKDPKKADYVGGSVDEYGEEGIGVSGKVKINGAVIEINKHDNSLSVYNKIREGASRGGVHVFPEGEGPSEDGNPEYGGYKPGVFEPGGNLVFVAKEYGSHAGIEIECDEELAGILGLPMKGEQEPVFGEDAEVSLKREDDLDKGTKKFTDTTTLSVKGDKVIMKDSGGFEIEVNILPGAAQNGGEEVKLSILDAGYMTFQLGANTGDSIDVSIGRIDTETLGIKHLNVGNHKDATAGMSLIDKAIEKVSAERSKLGAFQNRLEHTIKSLDETGENMTAAFVRIMDTDMAKEMTEYTAKQVLQQAGTSVLAQANERPQQVLSLLQG